MVSDTVDGFTSKDYTLVFCRRFNDAGQREILLGMKKRGFGEGRWNGFGGKVEAGESIEDAAVRELNEECEVIASNLKKLGYIMYLNKDIKKVMHCHVFETWNFEGISSETDEMRPQWFLESEIPFHSMWPDDRWWFSYMLAGKTFKGRLV